MTSSSEPEPRSPKARFLVLAAAILAAAPLATSALLGAPRELAAQEPAYRPTPEQRYFDWTELRFPPEEYRTRRVALAQRLRAAGGGVFLAPSARGRSGGETFRQSDDFLYLTGLEFPASVLVLDADHDLALLFTPRRDPNFENAARPNDYPGRPLADDPVIPHRTGIDSVLPLERLAERLAAWAGVGRTIWLDAGRPGPLEDVAPALGSGLSPAEETQLYLRQAYPRIELRNAYEQIARLRTVKRPAEVDALRRAAHATTAAIIRTASRIGPGIDERELAGAFEAACKAEGAQRVAFHPIVKSGPNSLWPWRILAAHYDRRNRALRDGELVILDVGCELDGYASDVGRTFPVSGRFTPEQRDLLEMEVGVADAILAAVRPGVTFAELTEVARAATPERFRPYMQVGLFYGHHLGLSTGDPSLSYQPLEPGMVFAVEPWYYDHERGIAVFTEDVVLVTRNGAELLSGALPRDPEGLERLVGTGR